MTYDADEKHEAINGVMTSSGIILPKGEK